MRVVKNKKEDIVHKLNGAGAYEWWYFDCNDIENEYSFVAIFYTGNPISSKYISKIKEHLKHPEIIKPSPQDFCSLSFNLYHKSRTIYKVQYDCMKEKFAVESVNGIEKVSMDKSNFYYNKTENSYYLNLNLSSNALNKFKAEFIFNVRSNENDLTVVQANSGKETFEKHNWSPAENICDVICKFKFYRNYKRTKTEFNGIGYYDHHWGNEALFLNVRDWFRGRVVTNEYSLVYFYILYSDESLSPFMKLIIYHEGKVIKELDEFEINFTKYKKIWFLNFDKDINITAENVKLKCHNKNRIDSGPNYERYLSRFELTLDNKTVINKTEGFSEFIKLKKYKVKS